MTLNSKIKNKFNRLINNKTFMTCALLTVVYLISGYWKWLEIGVTAIALIFFILQPVQKSFCVYMYLHSFTLSNIGYESCLIGTTICFSLVLLIKYIIGVKHKTYPIYKQLIIIMSSFILVSVLISLPNKFYAGAWMYLTYFPLFYLFFAMRKDFEINQAIKYMMSGVFITCGLSLIFHFVPKFQYNTTKYGNRFVAFSNHPNSLYIRALFGLTYYMYCLLNNKLPLWKFILIYLFSAVIILLTLSKMGIAMLCLMTFITVIIYLKQDFKKRIKYVGIFATILLIIALICHKQISSIFQRIFLGDAFFKNNKLNSLTTGRNDIWSDYFKQCIKTPFTLLFGNGLLTQEVFIYAQYEIRSPHSLYLFLLYRFGIVGILVLAYIVYLFLKLLNKEKPSLISYIPLIMFLLVSLVSNTMKSYNFTYIILSAQILFENCKPRFSIKEEPSSEQVSTKNEE